MNAPFLQVDGVWKRHGGVHALEGVGSDLGAGEAHVLPGENGTGKPTSVGALSGAFLPGESRTASDMPNLRRTS